MSLGVVTMRSRYFVAGPMAGSAPISVVKSNERNSYIIRRLVLLRGLLNLSA